jgi:hypothetical protein
MIGILASYQAGLPFFKNMLVGDLVFTSTIFAVYYSAKHLGRLEQSKI